MRHSWFAWGAILGTLAAATGCQRHHEEHAKLSDRTYDGRLSPKLKNLGNYRRDFSTGSREVRDFLNQGLLLVYGFNHAEALRSFEEAARLDPTCGMAYWGQALALAPNINDSAIGPDREKKGFEAIRRAQDHKTGSNAVERGLIEALTERFAAGAAADRAKLNLNYAAAMRSLYQKHPEDPDVATLYADAVMNTMPWNYWTVDGQPREGVREAVAALEGAVKVSPDHPGAHHIYIHATEASPDPDRAVPSAEKLGGLVPGAGHLVHMPSHIFIRVGRYADAVDANLRAVAADEDYISQCRAQGIYPAAYYPHNIHFLFAALSMDGRSKEATQAATKVATRHDHSQLNEPGFGFAHLLRTMPLFAMVRFGYWDQILNEPDPGKDLPFGQVVWHYARGHAFLARNDVESAAAELARLRPAARDPRLAGLKIFDLNELSKLASIAEHVLAGELAAKEKKTGQAILLLRKAVDIEDHLLYSEPPDWPIPSRHSLGAVLLAAGRAQPAEQVYREDLKRHRDNGWALRGLAESLKAQGKHKEAAEVEARFRRAWARSDIQIASSRI